MDHAIASANIDVSSEIHPDDHIFGHISRFIEGRPAAVENYLLSGRKCAQNLHSIIAQKFESPNVSVLEFAAGYGRVSRHLRAVMPEAAVTPCDIHPAAVEFIRQKFDLPAILSSATPEAFSTGDRFDVVFALSFFSHMPKSTWAAWLRAFAERTAPNGIVIFTTHGRKSTENSEIPFDAEGFAFTPSSDQVDLDSAEYGTTWTTFDYVYRHIPETTWLIRFEEAFWFGHQDLYVLRR